MTVEPTARAAGRNDGSRVGSWLPPFLFIMAAVVEFMSMLLMTMLRYGNQRLEPQLFDMGKTANVYGLFFSLPFILLFVTLSFLRRFHRIELATTAIGFASVGIVALTTVSLLQPEHQIDLYVGYLAWKAIELAFFCVALMPGRRSLWRKSVSVAILAVSIIVGTMLVLIATVLVSPIGSRIDELPRREYDAAVILGAAVWSGNKPSPVLRERIHRGYDLLKDETVQFLVVTGGRAPNELPEAEVARRELVKLGADPTRIVQESHTNSTVEQILYIREHLIQKQGWDSFVIVSDQFHLKRALEICQFNGINARGVSSESPLGPQNLAFYHFRESAALLLYWMFGA
jgi:vancomycin permeability regulator SanA